MEFGGAQTPESGVPVLGASGTSPAAGRRSNATDAMGLDKYRKVTGGRYRPTRTRQAAVFGTVLAITAILFLAGRFLANELDKPPAQNPDLAPWAQPSSPQTPPQRPL